MEVNWLTAASDIQSTGEVESSDEETMTKEDMVKKPDTNISI